MSGDYIPSNVSQGFGLDIANSGIDLIGHRIERANRRWAALDSRNLAEAYVRDGLYIRVKARSRLGSENYDAIIFCIPLWGEQGARVAKDSGSHFPPGTDGMWHEQPVNVSVSELVDGPEVSIASLAAVRCKTLNDGDNLFGDVLEGIFLEFGINSWVVVSEGKPGTSGIGMGFEGNCAVVNGMVKRTAQSVQDMKGCDGELWRRQIVKNDINHLISGLKLTFGPYGVLLTCEKAIHDLFELSVLCAGVSKE